MYKVPYFIFSVAFIFNIDYNINADNIADFTAGINMERKRRENVLREIRKAISGWIIFSIILGVGIFVIIYGAKPELFRDKSYVPTQAVVEKYEMRYSHSGGDMPHPVYNYVFEGEEYSVESETAVSPPPFKVGEEITVYVNPADPTYIITPIGNRFFIFFGIAVTLIAFFALSMNTYHVLDKAFPYSDWPAYIFRNIPILIFAWTIVAIVGVNMKSPSASAGFIMFVALFILLAAFATFLTVIMIKEIWDDRH